MEWTEIVAVHEPRPRSGHSACIYQDRYMIIYGGIEEITKELNDMHIFDCRTEKWMVLFEEINSPKKARQENDSIQAKKSAVMRVSKIDQNVA